MLGVVSRLLPNAWGKGLPKPTAVRELRGTLLLEDQAAADDTLSLCIEDSTGAPAWVGVSLATHTHASPGITVAEGGVSLDTDIAVLDFDASDFTLSEAPENEVNISLNYGTGAGQPAEGNHGHSYVGTIKEGNSAVVSNALSLDFNAAYFNITDEGGGEAGIALAMPLIVPVPARFPLGNIQDTGGLSTSLVSNSSYAAYMGRADAAYTSISLRVQVNTAAVTITWAEVGIGTSPAITLNGAASITRRGFTNVAASFNSTGDKTVAVAVSGINPGDHLWALFGSQATTPYQLLECASEATDSGIDQSKAATRISTMASPTTFGISAVRMPAGFWIGS